MKRSHLTLSLATCNSELVTLKKECEESQRAADELADIIVQAKRDVQLEYESNLSQAKEQLAEVFFFFVCVCVFLNWGAVVLGIAPLVLCLNLWEEKKKQKYT